MGNPTKKQIDASLKKAYKILDDLTPEINQSIPYMEDYRGKIKHRLEIANEKFIAELEQLKRDNEVLYRDNVSLSETADRLRGENYKLRASNARLREALERIANNYWTSSAAESMRTIARAALELEESK